MLRDRATTAGDCLVARVRCAITAHEMLAAGDTVVVAVSGGPDSLALLYALHALRQELGISLHVAHLNHRLRRAAGEEARFVAGVAESLGLPFTVEAVDVHAAKEQSGLSLEHAARRERYAFFGRVAAAAGAGKVATAHTADDNVETVLINLLRGAGTDGIGGIPPVRPLGAPAGEVWVVRPLIDAWRSEIEAYCRQLGLEPRRDASNRSRAFLRNRVRLDLLPYLERHFGENVKPQLRRLAEIARPEAELLERLAGEALARLSAPAEGGLALDAAGLWAADLAIRRRVVRAALRRVKGDPAQIGFEAIERVIQAAGADGTPAFDLPGPVHVRRQGDRLLLLRPAAVAEPFEAQALPLPGRTAAPAGEITAEVMDRPAGFEPPRTRRPREVYLDAGAVSLPLSVRTWEHGDRFQPLGLAGTKSLRRLFADAGVPAEERTRVPVVLDGAGVIWVAGLAIAERVKVTPATRRLLRLRWHSHP